MRVDYEKREIVCGVGDLVQESTYRRIGVERGDGFRRMWIGQDIHTRRAEQRANEDPHYRAEVHVVHRTSVGGWNVTVTGRIDGLSVDKEAKRVCIEEVKSIHFDLELEALYRSEKLQRHLYQLLLYAYFLSGAAGSRRIRVRAAARAHRSGLRRREDHRHGVRSRQRRNGAARPAWPSSSKTWKSRRRCAPPSAPSPTRCSSRSKGRARGQEEIVSAVARGIWQRDALLVSAPTGIGKTMAVLYPAVKQSLKLGKKLFFLTSKTLQQDAAVKALDLLNDGSFRVLRVRSKQKMCAHTEMICHEDFCPFAAKYSEKMAKSGLVTNIVTSMSYFDPDVTFELAKSTRGLSVRGLARAHRSGRRDRLRLQLHLRSVRRPQDLHAGEGLQRLRAGGRRSAQPRRPRPRRGIRRNCTRSRSRKCGGSS